MRGVKWWEGGGEECEVVGGKGCVRYREGRERESEDLVFIIVSNYFHTQNITDMICAAKYLPTTLQQLVTHSI